jgi:hypothetical protein
MRTSPENIGATGSNACRPLIAGVERSSAIAARIEWILIDLKYQVVDLKYQVKYMHIRALPALRHPTIMTAMWRVISYGQALSFPAGAATGSKSVPLPHARQAYSGAVGGSGSGGSSDGFQI